MQAFLSRPLQESGYAYVYLDATYLKGRLGTAISAPSAVTPAAPIPPPAWTPASA